MMQHEVLCLLSEVGFEDVLVILLDVINGSDQILNNKFTTFFKVEKWKTMNDHYTLTLVMPPFVMSLPFLYPKP